MQHTPNPMFNHVPGVHSRLRTHCFNMYLEYTADSEPTSTGSRCLPSKLSTLLCSVAGSIFSGRRRAFVICKLDPGYQIQELSLSLSCFEAASQTIDGFRRL